jgi:hypothetical protein
MSRTTDTTDEARMFKRGTTMTDDLTIGPMNEDDDDHDCIDWNSGGACFICRRSLSIEEQLRDDPYMLRMIIWSEKEKADD